MRKDISWLDIIRRAAIALGLMIAVILIVATSASAATGPYQCRSGFIQADIPAGTDLKPLGSSVYVAVTNSAGTEDAVAVCIRPATPPSNMSLIDYAFSWSGLINAALVLIVGTGLMYRALRPKKRR